MNNTNLMSSPDDKTMDRKARHGQYYHHEKDTIRLFPKSSEYDPENKHNLLWGDCIQLLFLLKI